MDDNRNRMWSLMFLYSLGLHICQSSGEGISTKIYYPVMMIEEIAIKNLTECLKSLILVKDKVNVTDATITTICEIAQNRSCNCTSDYKWSDEAETCVSKSTVTISGSFKLDDPSWYKCLSGEHTILYQHCRDDLLSKLKTVFSTIKGFENVSISKFSQGSVIAHVELTVVYGVSQHELFQKVMQLSKELNSSQLALETKGVVLMNMTSGPVCNNEDKITCTSAENLETEPVWHLTKGQGETKITNGTQSVVTSSPKHTSVTLKAISENWAGEFSCAYHKKFDFGTITHKASDTLDVVLLPDIHITSEPMFPRCEESSMFLKVTVRCEIKESSEKYNVTWNGYGNKSQIIPKERQKHSIIYAADTVVGCEPVEEPASVSCIFTNRCGRNETSTGQINVIYKGEVFCEREDGWGDTKVNFTAMLRCTDSVGWRFRRCTAGGVWGEEESKCVNMDLDKIREATEIIDIGLGQLDTNAAQVLSRLEAATNMSENINTYSNVNVSVSVLSDVQKKIQNISSQIYTDQLESTLHNFLQSSSNLLNESLEESWTNKMDKGNNLSLAENFLSSVSLFIEHTNKTNITQRMPNVEVEVCSNTQGSPCTNVVFNATVSLEGSDTGTVKTTGFKQLYRYFPNEDPNFESGGIVVSTTAEENRSHSTVIKINFQLLSQRPRNHKMECVSWDETNRRWSSHGCDWKGPFSEGHCECNHLSSFTILMSKAPLDIPLSKEITYGGLAISIVSLILSIAIELTLWSSVVKTSVSYLRHAAHINISLSLLIADCCFLASSSPGNISLIWCQITVVFKHFCYLSMFFWMLCLSCTLLHQTIFLFHNVSKRNYLRFSLLLGYACPFLIVFITFITNNSGAEGYYYSKETCWLIYTGYLKGSIHTFLIPVGMIAIVNVFCIFMVILKLLHHQQPADSGNEQDKKAVKSVIRSIILLTPIFGVTWLFGFGVIALDLTYGTVAFVVNYIFIVLNAFQGLFILMTVCLGDKLTRDALWKRFSKNPPGSTSKSTTTKLDSK